MSPSYLPLLLQCSICRTGRGRSLCERKGRRKPPNAHASPPGVWTRCLSIDDRLLTRNVDSSPSSSTSPGHAIRHRSAPKSRASRRLLCLGQGKIQLTLFLRPTELHFRNFGQGYPGGLAALRWLHHSTCRFAPWPTVEWRDAARDPWRVDHDCRSIAVLRTRCDSANTTRAAPLDALRRRRLRLAYAADQFFVPATPANRPPAAERPRQQTIQHCQWEERRSRRRWPLTDRGNGLFLATTRCRFKKSQLPKSLAWTGLV